MSNSVFEPDVQVDELDYRILDALRGEDAFDEGADDHQPLDHACPLCGPDRSSEFNQLRPVLRTWRLSENVISYKCARCDVQGYARFDAMSAYLPQRALPKLRAPQKAGKPVDLYYVERLWREATEELPPAVIKYFKWRGLSLDELASGVLRFHPQCPWPREGKLPCILARYTDALTGEQRGLWRRRITGICTAKPISLGPMAGCVIRLFPAVGKQLVIAEGIETALTAALHYTHRGKPLRPAWATGCDGNMRRFPVLAGIEQLVIIVDNDVSGAGQDAADECARRWRAAGRVVILRMPKQKGCDLNDVLMRKL
jgi:hypothetical protein